ncbi:enoyl-CoA hydratase/isomerase family protein [Dyadobacter psychrophilus]|uniref:2-(1,2-epoxy-1,2-dihydrophenyl)acetyl-CoA isomerase n=1 Tax=Dyadobacter psychrophilus TaxID=651661 RepID=A0A1T5GZU4_9BACT|nr:enoyl-CoA hydratase-related protein [Dyadobacter psychrophilus]SKC13976.1 2-(1,2-epoxy-1,2-dihydrophenyl)acetyl-CoA isomerase [Dyadobacter psychrophilus]
MYQHLLFENTDGIATITLNRPQVYHALSPALINEITIAVKAAESDDAVRVLIITGEGDKAFCSGADLKETASSGQGADEILREYYNPMIQAIRTIPKPVICRLNGLAVGAGCSLALACDVVIAREDTYLSLLFVQIGLMPDAGATFFLPRLVGMARAFEIASTGRKVYAPEAASIGLISRSVPATELDAAIEQTAAYYRNAPTQAIGAMKLVMNESFHSDLAKMQQYELENQERLFKTYDAQEGIASFLQKKGPDFQGR